jgi:hypothetical protein
MSIRSIFVNTLIWLDVKINDYVLFGKNETLSARMGRSIQSDHPNAIAAAICDFLDVVQQDHCKKSYEALLAKRLKKEMEQKKE